MLWKQVNGHEAVTLFLSLLLSLARAFSLNDADAFLIRWAVNEMTNERTNKQPESKWNFSFWGLFVCFVFSFSHGEKRIESILSIILTVDYQSTSVDGFADSYKKILSVNHV